MVTRWGKDIDMSKLRGLDAEIEGNKRNQELAQKLCADCSTPEQVHPCRLCGSEDTQLYFHAYGGHDYYACGRCKALFMDEIPDMKKVYTDEGNNAPFYIDDETFDKRVQAIDQPKVDFVLQCTSPDINKWVDIGPGGGAAAVRRQKAWHKRARHRARSVRVCLHYEERPELPPCVCQS